MTSELRRQACAALLLVILAYALRIPDLWLHPRFWAEEGAVYFQHALNHGFGQNLLAVQLSYFSLLPNLATSIAALLPLEWAPLVTTFFSALVMLVPHLIIWLGNNPLWHETHKKWLASAVILLVGQHTELWLNSITLQFHGALAVFLLLLEKRPERVWVHYALIALFMLNGVVACFFTPFYVARTIKRRSHYHITTALLLVTACMLHAVVAYMHMEQGLGERMDGRLLSLDKVAALPSISVHMLLLADTLFLQQIQRVIINNHYPVVWWFYLLAASYALLAGLLVFLFLLMKDRPRLYFIGGVLVTLLLSLVLVRQSQESSPRYAYLPVTLMTLGLVAAVSFRQRRVMNTIGVGLLMMVLAIHGMKFFSERYGWQADWLNWQEQVANWRAGEVRYLLVYPQWKGSHMYVAPPK